MGNCLACFKEPPSTAADTAKEGEPKPPSDLHLDMTTTTTEAAARLYPAPSHQAPTGSPPAECTALSNGNHLSGFAVSSAPGLLGGGCTTGAPVTAITENSSSAPASIVRLYPVRRCAARSASAMGSAESRQPSDGRLNALFEHYKDAAEDAILAEGIEQLCKDLQVPPDDFRVLVLAWRLNADQMCRFSRTEFVEGLRELRADSVRTVQARLPEVVAELERSDDQFKDLYRFTFRFGLDAAAGQRILPTDMATVLWRLVFTVREPPILGRWLGFLETHPAIRGVPRDTWNMFLNFAEAVGDDLSSYDDNEAWPSLFDDFVEYENDQANQNISKDKEMEGRGVIGEQQQRHHQQQDD